MKAQTMIFVGLFLLPSGILTGSILLFTSGSLSLLAGNLRLLSTMRTTDWQALVEMALARRVAAVTGHGLSLARAALATPIPAEVMAALQKVSGEPSARYLRPTRHWLDEFTDSVTATEAWGDRFRLLRRVALPTSTYMRARYQRPDAGPAGLAWLYCRRLIAGGWRVVTGQK